MFFNKVALVVTKDEGGAERKYTIWAQDGTSIETVRLTSDSIRLKSCYGVPLRLTVGDDPLVVASGNEVLDADGDLVVIHHMAVIYSDGRPHPGVVFNGGMITKVIDLRR